MRAAIGQHQLARDLIEQWISISSLTIAQIFAALRTVAGSAASPKLIFAETSPFPLLTRWRWSFKNSASFAWATLKCDVFSDFQTSLPPAKALA
jgi:hypothetical protein